jgi:glycosyltransferase involved in cell wall biosynthesis
MTSSLTVIIATMNSATNAPFRECIASIRSQRTGREIQVLVVDGGSSDETLSVARSYGARIIHNPARTELGFLGGKNLALRSVDTEFVSMIDADNVLIETSYLESMTRPLVTDSRIDVTVPTPYVPERKGTPSITRYFCLRERDYWSDLSNSGLRRDGWIEFCPRVTAIPNAGILRTAVLNGIGGWDYDTEVAARMIASGHGRFAMVPDAHRYHAEMSCYKDVVRKYSRRTSHQFENFLQKPTVAGELKTAIHRPVQALVRELVDPLSRIAMADDWTYVQAIPVLTLRAILLIKELPRYPSTTPSEM